MFRRRPDPILLVAQRPVAPRRELVALRRQAAARVFRARARDRWRAAWQYGVASRGISFVLSEAVKARDGHACVWCGAAERLEIDHVWPWGLGGVTAEANLQTLCRSCNR